MLLIHAHVDQFLHPGHYLLSILILLLSSDKMVELDFIVLLLDGKDV